MHEFQHNSSRNVVEAWSSDLADFDARIEHGDFDTLEQQPPMPYQRIAGNHLHLINEYRKHIKYNALPMHRRAWNEQRNISLTEDERLKQEMDISSAYSDYTDLMEHMEYRLSRIRNNPIESGNMRGLLTEATFMALFARNMRGDDDDHYIAVPSDDEEDIGTILHDNTHTGFDIRIIDRATHSHLKAQLKTSNAGAAKNRYQDDILVLNLEQIAGNRENIPRLRRALIQEVAARANKDQVALIDTASANLNHSIDRAFSKLHKRRKRCIGSHALSPSIRLPSIQDVA